jgi:hypothetical protein
MPFLALPFFIGFGFHAPRLISISRVIRFEIASLRAIIVKPMPSLYMAMTSCSFAHPGDLSCPFCCLLVAAMLETYANSFPIASVQFLPIFRSLFLFVPIYFRVSLRR